MAKHYIRYADVNASIRRAKRADAKASIAPEAQRTLDALRLERIRRATITSRG